MKDYLFIILNEYLKGEGIYLNSSELELQIISHPSYPSLHSLTSVLDHFNIDNVAVEVPLTIEVFNKLPQSFITLIKVDGGQGFAIVSKYKADLVKVRYSKKKKSIVKIHEFLDIWSGIVVAAETHSKQEEKRKKIKIVRYL
ncbi:cysteine peptidase family C39 domain-containing protein [Fulvivirga maritima]|uniref:cysteine peptidase family C39 domain-containing protein n=1 Tax=Fulvivirga maritima TaxID=2904247 RepID=UPI001F335266|nr:cysteine peptidase family C39 domain-containing protein [Fulvivirga maritima]UII25815.1 cysteine peptidase family C39 domain-containing protein [Fulvivirga maritima]